jgi:hypothetical protein
LVGAILKILCPRERRVFQSKLGVSSSNQCNLHHSPHTAHLEKKIKKGYNLFRTPCIFAAILHIGGRFSIRNSKTRHAVMTGTRLSRLLHVYCVHSYITFGNRKKHLVWTTHPSLHLHKALYNTAHNTLHIHTFLKICLSPPRWFNRGRTLMQ